MTADEIQSRLPVIPHSATGVGCCGCIVVAVRGKDAELSCNECGVSLGILSAAVLESMISQIPARRGTPPKPIRVENEEEFEKFLDHIASEVSDARDHWNLLKAMNNSISDYHAEMNESTTFWRLNFTAHREGVLAHLGRLYDKDRSSLSLGRLLLTVRANRDFFSETAFRKRLAGNPYVDTLVAGRALKDEELDEELKSVSVPDPLVLKLTELRDKSISHTDAEKIRKNPTGIVIRWLPPEVIDGLLKRAEDITSKYTLYFKASAYGGIAGANDFKSTLQWVRKGLSSQKAEYQKKRSAERAKLAK